MSNPKIVNRPVIKERFFLKKTIIFLIKLEVFLLPLFFLPFTFEIFEFSKQNLFWFLTGLAAILWLLNALIIEKKILYKRTPLDLPILIFLIIWGLSTLLSINKFDSFFGYYGRFSDAYLTTIFFVLLYFLIIAVFSQAQLKKTLNLLLWSLNISFLISVLAMSGLLARLFSQLTSIMILQSVSFTPIGSSVESLALTAAATLIIATVFYSYNLKEIEISLKQRISFYSSAILVLLILSLTNIALAWGVAFVGLLAILGFAFFGIYHNQKNNSDSELRTTPSLVLFFVSLVIMAVFSVGANSSLYQKIFNDNLPREVILNNNDSVAVTWQSFKNNPLFGSGPGTFAYDFSLHRPANFNSQQFWQLRFDKASSYLTELVNTTGLLGSLSYLVIIGIFLFVGFIFLKNTFRNTKEDNSVAVAGFFGVLILFVLQILYLNNIVLQFMFWVCLALTIATWRFIFAKVFVDKEIDLTKYKDFKPVFITIFAVAGIFFIWLSSAQARYYVADVYYNNFRLTGQRSSLMQAIKFNPQRLNYRLALARDYVNEVRDDINLLSSAEAPESIASERKAKLQNNIQLAVEEAKFATELAPNSVMAWESLGVIYRDIKLIAVGSLDPAIKALQKATKLEPSNPVLLTELAKLYLINNQTNEAINLLQSAIEQKSDYLAAYIGLAKVYETLDQSDKALVILEQVIQLTQNPELIYESGRLYYNQGDIDKAIIRFSQAVELRPSYANALYSMGLAYQQQGNEELALEQFTKVLELNPENEAVQVIIDEIIGEEVVEEIEGLLE